MTYKEFISLLVFTWVFFHQSIVCQADESRVTRNQVDPGVPATFNSHLEDLSTVQRLTIKVAYHPELSGDYRVNSDYTISVPLIGRLSVRDIDLASLEKSLSAKMLSITGRETSVTIEVAEYRPIFVTGFVRNDGAVPWHPGMTVLQALAMSGGLGRTALEAGATGDPARYPKAADDRKRALAVLARLLAEEAGGEVEVPAELVSLVGRKEAEALIKEQSRLLVARRQSYESQLSVIERGRSAAMAELEGLRTQGQRLARQLTLRLNQREKILGLKEKGLVPEERTLDQEFRVLELEEKSTNTTVGIARVQATIADLDLSAQTLRRTRETENSIEKAKLARDLAQSQMDMDAALLQSGTAAWAGLSASSSHPVPKYTITRKTEDQTTKIDADENTPLKPSDILLVSIVLN